MPAGYDELPIGAAWSGSPVPAPRPVPPWATARRSSPASSWHASSPAADSLPPFAMPRHCRGVWPALPTSDYYGGSVPSCDQQPTAGLPATGLDGRRGGRSQDGSHVHHQPVDGVGAQLFPGSLATGTPQTFPVASWPATSTGVRVALPSCWSSVRCCPAPIRQISSRFLSCGGSTTGSCNTYTFPSCLPGPGRLAVPTRPVVVGAAPTLPCASRVRLPPASPGRYDSPEVGLSSHPVKWRLVAHEVVEQPLTSM